MHDKSHTVVRLAVHLEDQQSTFFERGQEREGLQAASQRRSNLQAWFELNKVDAEAQQYRYSECDGCLSVDSQKWCGFFKGFG